MKVCLSDYGNLAAFKISDNKTNAKLTKIKEFYRLGKKKINNVFLRHFFLENDPGGFLFFILLNGML